MKKSFILLHISILLAGLTGIFGKLITLDAFYLSFYRLLIATGLLVLLMAFTKRFKDFTWTTHTTKTTFNGFLLALHWIFFYASIKFSNVSVGVICFCLTGVFTALLSPLINKKKVSYSELGLSALNILGISLIFQLDTSFRTGIILGIFSSITIALFSVINEKLGKKADPIQTTTLQMFGGSIFMALALPIYMLITNEGIAIPNMSDSVNLFLLSSFCTLGIYLLINEVLKTISAFTVNLSYNLEPIYSIIIAIVWFGEGQELGLGFYLGVTCILLSLVLQMYNVIFPKKLAKNT